MRRAWCGFLPDNKLPGISMAAFPPGVQKLEQSEAGLSKTFDSLHSSNFPNCLNSKERTAVEGLELNLPTQGQRSAIGGMA